MRVREVTRLDLPFLEEMLFEAFHWRAGTPRPPFSDFRDNTEFKKLLAGWGRTGDAGVVAEADSSERLGAAWYRFWNAEVHSYGYVDDTTPEVAIAVRQDRRGTGVGRALLEALIGRARHDHIAALSLSVDSDNRARSLYERCGFRKVGVNGTSWTMVLNLRPSRVGTQGSSSKERP